MVGTVKREIEGRPPNHEISKKAFVISCFRGSSFFQWEVFSSGSRRMYQLSQSSRDPPPSVTGERQLQIRISQRRWARLPCIGTVKGFSRLSGASCSRGRPGHRGDRKLAAWPEAHLELPLPR